MKTGYNHLTWVLLFSLGACGSVKENVEKKDRHSITVQLAEVQQKTSSKEVVGSGLLSSSQEAKPSFKIGGVIQKIHVKEGDKIYKGQVLATLNLTEINLQVAQAEEAYSKALRDQGRAQNLYQDSVATQEQAQNAGTALNVARQSLEIAIYNREYATIVSSVNGVVIKKMMNEGEIVAPGTPLFFINAATEADWVLKIGVSDKDWTRVQEGDPAEVSFDAYPDTAFQGTVKVLSQGADPVTGSYQIEIRINPNGKRLATGMFAKARIKTSIAGNYQLVPVESLVDGDGKKAFVYIPQGENVRKIPVQVAEIRGPDALVSQGLENINQVIGQGAGFLAENSTIVIQ